MNVLYCLGVVSASVKKNGEKIIGLKLKNNSVYSYKIFERRKNSNCDDEALTKSDQQKIGQSL